MQVWRERTNQTGKIEWKEITSFHRIAEDLNWKGPERSSTSKKLLWAKTSFIHFLLYQ